jgi:hypothetical protein
VACSVNPNGEVNIVFDRAAARCRSTNDCLACADAFSLAALASAIAEALRSFASTDAFSDAPVDAEEL